MKKFVVAVVIGIFAISANASELNPRNEEAIAYLEDGDATDPWLRNPFGRLDTWRKMCEDKETLPTYLRAVTFCTQATRAEFPRRSWVCDKIRAAKHNCTMLTL